MGPKSSYLYILYWILQLLILVTVQGQNVCIPPPCVRTAVFLTSNATRTRDPPYVCRGETVTFTCQVINGISLQWVSEPDICRSMPIRYTTAESEGAMGSGGNYQSYLIAVDRAPPFSNFSSNLTFTPNASVNSVTVQCGDQLSSCSNTEDESDLSIADTPTVTQEMLQYSFINNQGICPSVSAVIQLDEVAGIGLTYELSLLSSYGCVLQDCPMLVSPGRRVLNITLMDGENYTATLVVSNDCGSDSTTVLIQPEVCEVGTGRPTDQIVGDVVGGVVGGSVGVLLVIISIIIIVIFIVKRNDRRRLQEEQRDHQRRLEAEQRDHQRRLEAEQRDHQRRLEAEQVKHEREMHLIQDEAQSRLEETRQVDVRVLVESTESGQQVKVEFTTAKGSQQDVTGDSSDVQDSLHQDVITAIENGDIATVEQWLQKEDTRVNDCRGGSASHGHFIVGNGTALHWAVYYGQLDIARLLLKKGADPYEKTKWGESVLIWACQCKKKKRNKEVLQLLFDYADRYSSQHGGVQLVDFTDSKRRTPLHYACHAKNKALVQQLLRAGANPYARDVNNLAPMAPVSWLLDFQDKLFRQSDSQLRERTPLHIAARQGDMKEVQRLVDDIADINAQDKKGWTPLHMAAEGGHIDIVRHLVENGAETSIDDWFGRTPLQMAARRGHVEVVQYLGNEVPNINIIKDKDGRTPLHVATEGGYVDIMRYLVNKGADVNSKDQLGWTPLHIAAEEGDQDPVMCLVEEGPGIDINILNNDGKPPLLMAARQKHVGIVQYLFDKGAVISTDL